MGDLLQIYSDLIRQVAGLNTQISIVQLRKCDGITAMLVWLTS